MTVKCLYWDRQWKAPMSHSWLQVLTFCKHHQVRAKRMPKYWGVFLSCMFTLDSRMKAGQKPSTARYQVLKMCGQVLHSHDCKCQWYVMPKLPSQAGRCQVMQGLAGRNKQPLLINHGTATEMQPTVTANLIAQNPASKLLD